MARSIAKRQVLRAIAEHDGEWYWYQLDHALSGCAPDCIGPFFTEIEELALVGLIEIRSEPDLPGGVRYWITQAGRDSLAGSSEVSLPIARTLPSFGTSKSTILFFSWVLIVIGGLEIAGPGLNSDSPDCLFWWAIGATSSSVGMCIRFTLLRLRPSSEGN
jgi:hypothetical protein